MKIILKLVSTLCILGYFIVPSHAQIAINSDSEAPDSSAMLDITSSDKGILIPRMSSNDRQNISNPATGLMVFDTTTNSFWYYDQSQWSEIRSDNQLITTADLLADTPVPDFSCLAIEGSVDAGAGAEELVVRDNYGYVLEDRDLLIFDISDPTAPSQIGSFVNSSSSFPRGLALSDNYAYFVANTDGGTLTILDISDPTTPILTGSIGIGTNSSPQVVSVEENFAYIIGISTGELIIVDISDPAEPVLVSNLTLNGQPSDLVVAGNFAYVIDAGDGSLKIIDVCNPNNPSISGNLSFGDRPVSVALADNYLYVVDIDDDDLKSIDVSDPTAPFVAGILLLDSSPVSVEVSGNYAYTLDANQDDLSIIDISNPAVPNLIHSIDVANIPMDVEVVDNYAYVLNLSSIMEVIQLTCEGTVPNFDILNFDPLSETYTNPSFQDNQTIDKFNLNETTLELSLEDDGQNVQEVDLSSLQNASHKIIDADADTYVDVEKCTDEDVIRLVAAGTETLYLDKDKTEINSDFYVNFTGYSSVSSLSVQNPIIGDFFNSIGSSGSAWQSLTALNNGRLDFIQIWIGGSNIESNYEFKLYEGTGDSGQVLGTVTLTNPSSSNSYNLDFSNQNIDIEKGQTYSLWFDSRKGVGLLSGNPYPDGQASVQPDNYDFIFYLYLFEAEYGFSVEDGIASTTDDINILQSDISILQNGVSTLQNDILTVVPIGTIQMWPTSSPPSGWLICNGSSFSSSTYPDLETVLGTTTLPNFNGRFPLGSGNSSTNGSTSHSLSSTGGEEKHTLTVSEMPSHSHGAGSLKTSQTYLSEEGSGNQDKRDGGGTKLFAYDDITGSTASVGGNQAHNNMPPFYTINFIIKAK